MAKTKEDRKKEQDENKKAKGKDAVAKDENFKEEKVPVRLLETYNTKVIPELMKKFGYKNKMQAPKLEKICINVGVGKATEDQKIIDVTVKEIEAITGQKPAVVKAKKSVSNFKLREGMKIGVRTTLRNARMYEFLDRFINISIPRIRDFRGLPDKSFDGRGNYTIGIKEQVIFPEINVDNVTKISGMDITFVTNAKTDEESYELLKQFGVPFVNKK
ncbi:MAG TPA: 50S ribosomal protein L5 [Ignavibacteria bacterium]|nr:50S ribosomal protein L5 [Ignavibacteria bacterium]